MTTSNQKTPNRKAVITQRLIELNDKRECGSLSGEETTERKKLGDELEGIWMMEKNEKDMEWLRFMDSRR